MIKRKALDINRMDGNSQTLCCQWYCNIWLYQ